MKKILKFSFVLLAVLFSGNFLTHITFADPTTPIIVSIEITTPANKTEYNVGDVLDISGLVVTGIQDDKSKNIETITADNISGFDSASPKTGEVLTITVGTQTATYTINVNALPTATFIIRNGDSVLYNGSVTLPASAPVEINDASNVAHSVDTRSVLALLKNIDDSNDTFSISNLQYYDSFGSFYLKCILPNSGTDLCDNWQYAVGDSTPPSSIDKTTLSGGETVGIYFGNSHQLALSANAITTGGSLTATSQKYDYENNIWNPLTGVSVGVTLPNPSDSSNPTIVSTYPVDDLGVANITITGVNTYTLGIVEDYYFPSYTVTVSASSSGGGGTPPPTFDASKAITYLKSVQDTGGSFGGVDLYTDWAAIAFGASNVTGNAHNSLLTYLSSHNELSSLVTDNERRAMALLALGQNPYSFHNINYIGAITDSFDGTQFGDADLVNDDIFALIPLANSGYTSSDDIISKDIAFIISKQKSDGSWEESVDITAAAIEALKPFNSVSGVFNALSKASDYLVSQQSNDGGWGNISSTSWAMQAMGALNASWTKSGHTPEDYLGAQQADDGAASPTSDTLQNCIWATSYAIAGDSLKPWSEIMQSVSKPKIKNNSSDSSHLDNIEIINPPTPPTLPVNQLQTNLVAVQTVTVENKINTNNVKKITQRKLTTHTDTKKEISPEIFTATAVNALPAQAGLPNNKTPHKIPIIVGVISGILLLFLVRKFIFA